MAKIDDPTGKIEEHYFKNDKTPGEKVVKEIVEKGLIPNIPKVGWLLNIVLAHLKSRSDRQTLLSLERQILEVCEALGIDIENLKKRVVSEERIIQLIEVGLERSFWGANDCRVRKFASVIGYTISTATTDQQFEDAAFFVRALDDLSEDDIKVLNHLYKYQGDLVKENHHVDYNRLTERTRIESVLRNVGDLKIQMDEFYARCARLSGYGLALPVERNTKFDPSEYMFRITLIGKRLIEILAAAEK